MGDDLVKFFKDCSNHSAEIMCGSTVVGFFLWIVQANVFIIDNAIRFNDLLLGDYGHNEALAYMIFGGVDMVLNRTTPIDTYGNETYAENIIAICYGAGKVLQESRVDVWGNDYASNTTLSNTIDAACSKFSPESTLEPLPEFTSLFWAMQGISLTALLLLSACQKRCRVRDERGEQREK